MDRKSPPSHGRPIARQKLGKTVGGMVHETSHHIFQIFSGVDTKGSAGLYYRQNDCCSFSATFIANEQPVFSSDSDTRTHM